MIYADSSLITSCYIQDAMTAQALAVMMNLHEPLPMTPLQRLEIRNATKLAVFRDRITPAESDAAWADFVTDYRAGKFVRAKVNWLAVLRDAYRLAFAHSITLDILHVAAAKQLGTQTFLTFDKRQRSLALAVGLQVLP